MILKRVSGRVIFFLIIFMQVVSAEQIPDKDNISLKENLKILEPLINKKWVGQIKALDSDKYMKIVRQFSVMWDGNAIKITSYCKELNTEREGYIYWDFAEKKISMIAINNKGTIQKGSITEEQGKIVISGDITFPDRKLRFKNIFEITPEGKLIDRWFRYENGEWLAGHNVEMVVEK